MAHRSGPPKIPPLAEIEKRIGIKAPAWKARCYEIATLIIHEKVIKGFPVYGHWTGPIAPTSLFGKFRHIGFVRHGWILTPDDYVVDPTRWVFEDEKPYIFVGKPSREDGDWPYDEGGDRMRRAMMRPPPKYDPLMRRIDLGFRAQLTQNTAATARAANASTTDAQRLMVLVVKLNDAIRVVESLFGDTLNKDDHDLLSVDQAMWLANVPYEMLGSAAFLIYDALDASGARAFVPVDNWIRAQRENRDDKE